VVDSILHGVQITNGHNAAQVLREYISSGYKAGKKVAEIEKQQAAAAAAAQNPQPQVSYR
jgi:hypothetical protein